MKLCAACSAWQQAQDPSTSYRQKNESSNRKEESRLEREKRGSVARSERKNGCTSKMLRKEYVRHREFMQRIFLQYRLHWQLEYLTTNDIYVECDLRAYLQMKATE